MAAALSLAMPARWRYKHQRQASEALSAAHFRVKHCLYKACFSILAEAMILLAAVAECRSSASAMRTPQDFTRFWALIRTLRIQTSEKLIAEGPWKIIRTKIPAAQWCQTSSLFFPHNISTCARLTLSPPPSSLLQHEEKFKELQKA